MFGVVHKVVFSWTYYDLYLCKNSLRTLTNRKCDWNREISKYVLVERKDNYLLYKTHSQEGILQQTIGHLIIVLVEQPRTVWLTVNFLPTNHPFNELG